MAHTNKWATFINISVNPFQTYTEIWYNQQLYKKWPPLQLFPVIFTEFCFLKRAHFSYHPCILEILTTHTFNVLTFYSIQGIIHLYYLLKIFGKLTFLTPGCVSGGRKCYFSGKCCVRIICMITRGAIHYLKSCILHVLITSKIPEVKISETWQGNIQIITLKTWNKRFHW